jgi:hypothetical protein
MADLNTELYTQYLTNNKIKRRHIRIPPQEKASTSQLYQLINQYVEQGVEQGCVIVYPSFWY